MQSIIIIRLSLKNLALPLPLCTFGNIQATDFTIDQFNSTPGNQVVLNIQAVVPVGITTLQIVGQDLTGDDLIGKINLTENMSVENEVTLRNDSAVYILRYVVTESN